MTKNSIFWGCITPGKLSLTLQAPQHLHEKQNISRRHWIRKTFILNKLKAQQQSQNQEGRPWAKRLEILAKMRKASAARSFVARIKQCAFCDTVAKKSIDVTFCLKPNGKKGYLVRVKKTKNRQESETWMPEFICSAEKKMFWQSKTGRFVRMKTIWALLREH